jgi:hypothetical protein
VNFASTINSAGQALTINTGSGAITLSDAVGSSTALGAIALNSTGTTILGNTVNADSLTTNSGGGTIIYGGSAVTTSGAQTYNDSVTVASSPTVFQGSAITFGSGSTLAAGSNDLTLLADAMTFLGGPGSMTGTGDLRLGAQDVGTSIGVNGAAGALQITGTDLAALGTDFTNLTIGQIGQSGTVSVSSAVVNLAIAFESSGSINTSGLISTSHISGLAFYGPVTLIGATTLTSAGNISLTDTVDGPFDLTLNPTGQTTISNTLGNSTPLSSLTANGTTVMNGSSVTTSGSQTYNDTVSLGAPTVLTSDANNITFSGTLSGGSESLTLIGGASGNHVFTFNDIASLGTLAVNGNPVVTNTLALLTSTGTNTWTITNNGGSSGSDGTIAAANMTSGGFNNIQNLTGGTAINNFNFNDGAAINGAITGGGSGANNTLDFTGYTTPVTVTLAIPSTGNEFRDGTAVNNVSAPIIGSFTQIGNVVGPTSGQSTLVVPNKVNISIVYTNPAQTSGYINDPFFFSNMVVQYTPPSPSPLPPAVDSQQLIAIVGVASPTTSGPSNNEDNITVSDDTTPTVDPVSVNINQIIQQQASLDTELYFTVKVGCF